MMLILQGITYLHPNRDLLFDNLNLMIHTNNKVALIGHNGVGKSTLLKLLAGQLAPAKGLVKTDSEPYFVPQIFGQFNTYTIAQALRIDDKLKALNEILNGHMTDENLLQLNDDWTIEERCFAALEHWGLDNFRLDQKMETLSGGQKTKVFLAGIMIHRPTIVLLDEPTNHLDVPSRAILHDYITTTKNTLIVVSHDRALLNLLNTIYELHPQGITAYGGNYDDYEEQKRIEKNALDQDLKSKEKALRAAKEVEQSALERQQKLDARGKRKQEKAGMPTIVMHMLRNNAENSTSRLKGVHQEKVSVISQELSQMRKALPYIDQMKMDLHNATIHKGKMLINATNINFAYNDNVLWKQGLNFQITSGERIALKGSNGAGKTTLIKMILNKLQPQFGIINRAPINAIYIDQDYSLIDDQLTVYEQAQQYNTGALQEHEIKIRLNRFLFNKLYWNKSCMTLSGGEKMRLMLCALTISNQAPDLIILDEPTNNLDLQNIAILTTAINEYQGTLLVVSHDVYFLKQIYISSTLHLV